MTDTRPPGADHRRLLPAGLQRVEVVHPVVGRGRRDELRGTDVTLTSLMPGPTDTNFFDRAEMTDTVIGRMKTKDDPAEVARQGFAALMRGDQKVVAESLSTTLMGLANRVLTDSVKAVANRVMSAPVNR